MRFDSVRDVPHPVDVAPVLELKHRPGLLVDHHGLVGRDDRERVERHVVEVLPEPVLEHELWGAPRRRLLPHRLVPSLLESVQQHYVRRKWAAQPQTSTEAVRQPGGRVHVHHVELASSPAQRTREARGEVQRLEAGDACRHRGDVLEKQTLDLVTARAQSGGGVVNDVRDAPLRTVRDRCGDGDPHVVGREAMLVFRPEQGDQVNGESGSYSYDVWHSGLSVETEATEPWHLLVRRQLDPARDLAGRRVLEIGCGRGGFSCWLAGQTTPGPDLVAVDYSSVAVEKGRAYATAEGISNITWQTGDIQAIDHSDGSFDTVISCETIEHVPEPKRAVAELARVLKPGGRLFLTTPNYFGPFGLYRAYLRLRGRRFTEVGQPINQLTMFPRTLLWIRRAGLTARAVEGDGHYLLLPGREPRRIDFLDRPFLKWFATHGLVVAQKPA